MVATMRKYQKLSLFLKNREEKQFKCNFKDIENILGESLPKSARAYRVWWANHSSHIQAVDGWLNIGWKVRKVDMKNEVVEFSTIKK